MESCTSLGKRGGGGLCFGGGCGVGGGLGGFSHGIAIVGERGGGTCRYGNGSDLSKQQFLV